MSTCFRLLLLPALSRYAPLPFMAGTQKRGQSATGAGKVFQRVLTGDVGRCLEAAKNIGVHVDNQVLLVDELLVPCLDALMCPVCEWLLDQSVDKVDDPLPRQSS